MQRITAFEAERMVFANGFKLVRSKDSHRIYMKDRVRIVIPYHTVEILHPKISKQILAAIGKDD